jgi:hypothetical protein
VKRGRSLAEVLGMFESRRLTLLSNGG